MLVAFCSASASAQTVDQPTVVANLVGKASVTSKYTTRAGWKPVSFKFDVGNYQYIQVPGPGGIPVLKQVFVSIYSNPVSAPPDANGLPTTPYTVNYVNVPRGTYVFRATVEWLEVANPGNRQILDADTQATVK
jgi:hypothetical protein